MENNRQVWYKTWSVITDILKMPPHPNPSKVDFSFLQQLSE